MLPYIVGSRSFRLSCISVIATIVMPILASGSGSVEVVDISQAGHTQNASPKQPSNYGCPPATTYMILRNEAVAICCPGDESCNGGTSAQGISPPTATSAASMNLANLCSSVHSSFPAKKCNPFPGRAVVAGFFPGVVVGSLGALLVLFCLRKRLNHRYPTDTRTLSHRTARSGPSLGDISGPIPSTEEPYVRTDFLRHTQNSNNRRSRIDSTGMRMERLSGHSANPSSLYSLPIRLPPVALGRGSAETSERYTTITTGTNDSMSDNGEDMMSSRMVKRSRSQDSLLDPFLRYYQQVPSPSLEGGFQMPSRHRVLEV